MNIVETYQASKTWRARRTGLFLCKQGENAGWFNIVIMERSKSIEIALLVGHWERQVLGARRVQRELVRDVDGWDSGTYWGWIPAYSNTTLPGEMVIMIMVIMMIITIMMIIMIMIQPSVKLLIPLAGFENAPHPGVETFHRLRPASSLWCSQGDAPPGRHHCYQMFLGKSRKYENILVAFLLIDQLNHHCDQYVFTCLLFLYLSIFLGALNMINTTIIISHMHLHYNHNNDHNRRMLGQPLMRQILAPLPTMSSGIWSRWFDKMMKYKETW